MLNGRIIILAPLWYTPFFEARSSYTSGSEALSRMAVSVTEHLFREKGRKPALLLEVRIYFFWEVV